MFIANAIGLDVNTAFLLLYFYVISSELIWMGMHINNFEYNFFNIRALF